MYKKRSSFSSKLNPETIYQFLINALHGQAHHVKVASVKRSHTYVTYPLLYAVSASLVKGFIM